MDKQQLLLRISGIPNYVAIKDFMRIIEAFGFLLKRSQGGHFIYKRAAVPQHINIQTLEYDRAISNTTVSGPHRNV